MAVPMDIAMWETLKQRCYWLTPDDLSTLERGTRSINKMARRILSRSTLFVEALVELKKGKSVVLVGQRLSILKEFQERIKLIADILGIEQGTLIISEEKLQQTMCTQIYVLGYYPSSSSLLPAKPFIDF